LVKKTKYSYFQNYKIKLVKNVKEELIIIFKKPKLYLTHKFNSPVYSHLNIYQITNISQSIFLL